MEKMTFIKLYEKSFRKNFDFPAMTDYGSGKTFTYGEVAKEIAKLHILFKECKINPGDKISVIGKNSCRWCIAHLATVTYGAIIVPILHDFNASDVQHIINHSDSTLLFAADTIWETLTEEGLPGVKGIISLTDFRLLSQREDEHLDELIAGLDKKFADRYPHGFGPDDINYSSQPDDEMVVLNYTSGTTGFSKGVMILGRNLSGNMEFAHNYIGLKRGDRMLSFLPLAHTYGAAFDFLYALTEGVNVTFLGKTPAPKVLLKAFEEVQPEIIISVPLIFEKIYKNMIIPTLNKKPISWALSFPLLDTQIYAQIRKKLIHALGGKARQVIVGGAPFNSEVEDFLLKIKFPISVGYGMTECAPLISFSLCADFVPHSCGKVLSCMEARIDSEDPETIAGEIQVRGQNVMAGYYKNEAATKEAFTDDGWLKTGDLGTLDKNNNLFIRGRSKSMILGPSGQNIYPEEIEAKLNNLPFVTESLVVEKNRRLIALVYPDYDAVDESGLSHDDLALIMEENKATLNKSVASYEKIAEIQLFPNEFEKTPKKSIKRYLYNNI
ncbi:long-chain-fatty-acid--CoA ligase [Bacteroidia bacterium]|nr:long-chain-fatty-acid--CoA ligase [Bacteroidia bacterium]GHT60563.1 long-chain-fatty-acid--CoA ligase [Bacteroidia bacterium]